ncbi:MAG: hypothetical protein O3C27_07580 [Actinomycetota bacterium]|nr:hypothetical protein [Actinomycetota bacterium]
MNFRTYTPGDGLPATETADIEGDQEGLVWFASIGGLAKFDGRTFTRDRTDHFDRSAMPQIRVSDLAPEPPW